MRGTRSETDGTTPLLSLRVGWRHTSRERISVAITFRHKVAIGFALVVLSAVLLGLVVAYGRFPFRTSIGGHTSVGPIGAGGLSYRLDPRDKRGLHPYVAKNEMAGVSYTTILDYVRLETDALFVPGRHVRWHRKTGFKIFDGEFRSFDDPQSQATSRHIDGGYSGREGHYIIWRPDGSVYMQVEFKGWEGEEKTSPPWWWGVKNQTDPRRQRG